VDQARQAGEAEREGDRDPQHQQNEESAEQHQRGHAGRQRLAHDALLPVMIRKSLANASPRNSAQVAPASGQAMKMNGIGSSASSDSWYQPNWTNRMPQ